MPCSRTRCWHLVLTLPALLVGLLLAGSISGDETSSDSGIGQLVQLLGEVDDAAFQLDLLRGIREGIAGRKDLTTPKGWAPVYAELSHSDNEEVRELAQVLALAFGDPAALAQLRSVMLDAKAPADRRQRALEVLVEKHAPKLSAALRGLLADRALRAAALRALAAYDDPQTPRSILAIYAQCDPAEQQNAVLTLASRSAYAKELLQAVEKGTIPSTDISAYTARQLHALGDRQISETLIRVWGEIRETSADKARLIDEAKAIYTPEVLKAGRPVFGRLVFQQTCAQCHTLFGEGGKIGPDLTGSHRSNLHYVLENVLDPSAAVGNAYRVTSIVTTGGRLISGILQEQTDSAVTIQTANERLVLSREDIDVMKPSPVSMMPEGMLSKLSREQVRDLIVYLAAPDQVALPQGAESAAGDPAAAP